MGRCTPSRHAVVGLFIRNKSLDLLLVGLVRDRLLAKVSFALRVLLGQDVGLVGMRDLRLTILGHLKAFLGARVCLDFRHCCYAMYELSLPLSTG